jgi:hypothetical protein
MTNKKKVCFDFDAGASLDQVLEEFEEFLLDNGHSFEGNLYVVDTSEMEDE